MFEVTLKGEVIAKFAEKPDALAYIEYKHTELMQGFAAEQVQKYIAEHPYTAYGTRTLPGEVPLKETYPDYKAYSEELKNSFSLEPEDHK